jgi:hypothetical protein
MVAEYPYKGINQVMRAIRTQVIESVPYCQMNTPKFSSVENLYHYLKSRVKFVHDPEHEELLQSAPTLFDNNQHGTPGAGDCDCFTILTTATCIANGWECSIKLAGNSLKAPSHIYNEMRLPGGHWYTVDLTQPAFNRERKYKFYQTLPITHN